MLRTDRVVPVHRCRQGSPRKKKKKKTYLENGSRSTLVFTCAIQQPSYAHSQPSASVVQKTNGSGIFITTLEGWSGGDHTSSLEDNVLLHCYSKTGQVYGFQGLLNKIKKGVGQAPSRLFSLEQPLGSAALSLDEFCLFFGPRRCGGILHP